MVVVLLLMVFLALLTVGLWAYTRVVLTSAAAQAARYVANANVSDSEASGRARELLGDGLIASTRGTLTCTSSAEGLLVGVTCTMRTAGLVGFLDGVMPDITVTGHSVKETVG